MKRIAIASTSILAILIFLASCWFHMKVYAEQEGMNQSRIHEENSQQNRQGFENWGQLKAFGYGLIYSLSYSPDGSRLALAGHDAGFIEVRETKFWRIQLQMNEPYVRSVAWSPDGNRLVSGSDNRTIKIWDSHTGRLLNTLAGHTNWVNSVSWSADGRKLASGSPDQTVRIWDGQTGDLIRTIQQKDFVSTISWSPDNMHVAASSADRTVKIWNSETGELVRTLSGHTGRVLWVSWSPDGTRLASSAEDRTAIIWDTKTGKLLLTLRHDHPGTASYIYTVAWSPDSRLVATAVHYHDPAIWIWEAESGKLVTTISLPRLPDGGEVTAYRLAWSPDGSQIASSFSGGKFRIWDPKTGKLIGAPQIYFASGQLVRWSPDNRRLVAPGGDSQLGFTIEILNVETDEIIQFPSGHRYRLNSVDWSPDGRRIASNSDALDGAIKIWNAETEELLLTIEETGDVPALRFSPDATRIAYGIWDGFSGEIKIRDRETSDILQIIPTRVLSSIRWLPADGTKLASIGWIPEDGSSRGIIEIHEAETGDLVGTILEDRNIFFTSLDWSPDGTRFATGLSRGLDSWIKIWEVETGKLLSTLTDKRLGQVHSVVWSPDGQYIASATGSVVRVWDAEHGQLLRTFTGHNRDVVAVDWSSDGSRIASAAWDGSIRIWGERPKDASNSPKSAANSLSANNKLSPDSIEPSFEPLGFKSDRQNLSFSASNQSRIQGGAATRKSWLKNLFNLITFKSRRRY